MAGLLKNKPKPSGKTAPKSGGKNPPKGVSPIAKTKAAPGAVTPKAREKRRIKARDGLNRMQERALQQQERADVQLGSMANDMLSRVDESYEQPFDFSQLPSAPVSGDFNDWRTQQIDQAYKMYTDRQEPQFAKQREQLEQDLYNRGIPVGSGLYNQQVQELERAHNDARQSAMTNAQAIAGQNAGQFFDIGSQARGNALNEGMLERNMPLSEMQALRGAQSGFNAQNLAYNQQRGLTGYEADLQLRNARQMPRGGGGGNAAWQQYGFSSPMEYDAYKTQKEREDFLWAQQNTPKQKSINPWAGLLGGVGSAALGGWASSGFET